MAREKVPVTTHLLDVIKEDCKELGMMTHDAYETDQDQGI